jgi:hypothetical protein
MANYRYFPFLLFAFITSPSQFQGDKDIEFVGSKN